MENFFPKLAKRMLFLTGALVAGVSGAQPQGERSAVAVVSPTGDRLEVGEALDQSGQLTEPELIEYLQMLGWTRQQPPRIGSRDSIVGRSFAAAFQAVSGGANSSQDLVRVNPDLPR